MKEKILRPASTIAVILGLVVLFGAVGDVDCGTCTLSAAAIRVAVGIVLTLAGLLTKAAIEREEGQG